MKLPKRLDTTDNAARAINGRFQPRNNLMDKLVIHGGQKLEGIVSVSGAKNAALPLMTLSLLAHDPFTLKNVPNLQDVKTLTVLLRHLGVDIKGIDEIADKHVLQFTAPSVSCLEAPYDLVRTMRASILVLGPLVARFGHARVSMPGGCAIGARPIDQHLKGLKAMGASFELQNGYVECRAKRLHGAKILLDFPTVTGVENLMMAASLAKGMTRIENAAKEPEVVELAEALKKMGARIEGAGTDAIEIEGVDTLSGIEHRIHADRIESGTFMVAAAMTEGDILVKGARWSELQVVVEKLQSMNVKVTDHDDGIVVQGPDELAPCDITTAPFPGFPTDMQAQFMALATRANGKSTIKEMIFENRFMHVPELSRMGADIRIDGRIAHIRGKTKLKGATVMATDLRASASLVLAGLAADGVTTIRRVYHLDRGYDSIEKKCALLGAEIRRETAS